MKLHSNEFKTQIKNMGRELDSKITYQLEGKNIELGKEKLNSITPYYKGSILKSVMKGLDIDSNVDIPVGTELTYQFGVKVGNAYEYLDYGLYIVFSSEKQEDTGSYKIACYDRMLNAMKEYEPLNVAYPISIRDYIIALCNKLNIPFANVGNFANYNRMLPRDLYENQGYTYRDVLDELAQVTASTICINDKNQLEPRYITDTKDIIDEEYLKDINVNFGKKFGPVNSIVLSRSNGSDNVFIQDEASIQKNGLCEIKIKDNQIMNFNDRSDYLNDILGKLNGLEYYVNDFVSTGIAYYDLCDRYNVKIADKTYSCVMLNDELEVTQGLVENIYTEAPSEEETDYTKADKTDRRINQTYLIVDKQNQIIESVVANETDQNQKISQIQQTVDELNSKIKDIANITISGETQFGTVDLNGVNESEPIYLKIRPTLKNISYLYPRNNLYPSNNLFSTPRIVRFYNKKTSVAVDYELPTDLLIFDKDTYDEFVLDYDSKTCMVNKRVEYDKDGNLVKLPKMKTISFDYPKIPLEAGDYTVSTPSYTNAYIFVRLMAENIYTTQFATKVELESSISQTATEINLEVSKKVGKEEVISRINQTAEAVTIDAQKVNVNGVVSLINKGTTTTIDGDRITTGTITAQQIQTDAITTDKIKANAINGSKIQAGSIDSTKVTADVITTNNFNAQKINADNITAGTLTGRAINGGSVTGASISGGSIDIKKGNYYFDMGKKTSHPNCSGLNVGFGGINVNNLGFNSDGNAWTFAGDLKAANFKTFGKVSTNDITANSMINILSGGSSGTASNGGILLRTGNGHITLDAGNGAGYVYASGVGVATSKVKTDKGSASSKNTKTNFVKFDKNNYQEVLELLNNIDIYSYDYKYDLYDNKHQYGFIIDEIEKQNNYDKYFDFRKEKAKVKGNHIDFQVEENDKDYIEVKKYNEDTLDKYMLACLKAQQQEIEQLKQEIKELKNMI